MTIKSILAIVSDDDASRPTLDVAVRLARTFSAHVDALHVRADPRGLVPYTGEGMDGSMIEEIMDVTEREGGERAGKARQMFDAFCGEQGLKMSGAPQDSGDVTIAWREEVGREDEVVAVRGRLYDMIVVGRPLKDSALPSPITLEAALLDTGRPIVIAPPEPPATSAKSIAIAGESSPEAARAIADAMPLLAHADTVTILAPDQGQPPVITSAELVTRLAWHGVQARTHEFDARTVEIGAGFLKAAGEVGADLLVKGAYSQSRLRQMILGGRTRHIIANTTIPVLLAH